MTPPPDLYASAARAGYTALGYRDLYEPDELAILVGERAGHPHHRAVVDHVWHAALDAQVANSAAAVGSMRGAADLDQRRAELVERYGALIRQTPGDPGD